MYIDIMNGATLAPIDSRVISEFNVICGYLVDIFANERYIRARELWKNSNKISSVTDGYYASISEYFQLLKKEPKFYIRTLEGIVAYYRQWTQHKDMTITMCIDHILQHFIPLKFFYSLKDSDKEASIQQVLTNIIKNFSEVIIKKYTSLIIDKRRNDIRKGIQILRDELREIMIKERDAMFCRFAIGQENLKVDAPTEEKVVITKMKQLAQKFLDQRKQVEEKLKKAIEILKEKNQEIKTLKESVAEQIQIVSSRDDEIDKLYTKIEELSESLANNQTWNEPIKDDEEPLITEKLNIPTIPAAGPDDSKFDLEEELKKE
jgi:uncharacterized coiled-coil protein SlyX